MPAYAEVTYPLWIAAPLPVVRAQFADLRHHIEDQVHPKLQFELLEESPGRMRFVQKVRLLGLTQRDVFERQIGVDTIVDTSVEGFNKGGSLVFRFAPQAEGGREGTSVQISVRLPLPPLIGGLIRPLLEAQVRREVHEAAMQDKRDIEVAGYRPREGAGLKLAA